jgi:hypothetical protein
MPLDESQGCCYFKACGGTLILAPGNNKIHSLPFTYFDYYFHFLPFLAKFPLFGNRHSLRLARSDIDRKGRVEIVPIWSLHKVLLVNQKVL